jgi:hypothetical protein
MFAIMPWYHEGNRHHSVLTIAYLRGNTTRLMVRSLGSIQLCRRFFDFRTFPIVAGLRVSHL